jgi:hypothetical protein
MGCAARGVYFIYTYLIHIPDLVAKPRSHSHLESASGVQSNSGTEVIFGVYSTSGCRGGTLVTFYIRGVFFG